MNEEIYNGIVSLIKDNINEATNCEDIDISKDYLNGYIKGLEHSLKILEFNSFYDVDFRKKGVNK